MAGSNCHLGCCSAVARTDSFAITHPALSKGRIAPARCKIMLERNVSRALQHAAARSCYKKMIHGQTVRACCKRMLPNARAGHVAGRAQAVADEEEGSSSGSLEHPGLVAPRRQRAAGGRPATARAPNLPKNRSPCCPRPLFIIPQIILLCIQSASGHPLCCREDVHVLSFVYVFSPECQ